MGVRVLCGKVSPFPLTWNVLRLSVATPIFLGGWETGTTAAPPLYEWFLAFIPQKTQGREPNCTASWQEQQLSSIPWLWTSKGVRGCVLPDFFLFCLLFICLISKGNNSNLINLPSYKSFPLLQLCLSPFPEPFLLLLLLPWTKMDRTAEVEAVLQTHSLWATEKQVKARLNSGSALARSAELS